MSDRHLIEAIAEETTPKCPHCDGEDLRVVYRAFVTQGVMQWERTGDTSWTVQLYDTAEIDYDGEVESVRVDCYDCGAVNVMAQGDTADAFEMVSEEEPATEPTEPGSVGR